MTKMLALLTMVAAVTFASCNEKNATLLGVEIDPSELQLDVDDEEQLNIVCTPSDYEPLSVEWKSSDENVAYVSKSGALFAIADGKAKIMVTVDGFTATCDVNVGKSEDQGGEEEGEEDVLPLSVNSSRDYDHAGEKITLTANQDVQFELVPSVSETIDRVFTSINQTDSKTCVVSLGYIVKNGICQDDEIIIKVTTSDNQEKEVTLTSHYWKPELYLYSNGAAIKDINGTYSTDEQYSLANKDLSWSVGQTVAVVVKYNSTTLYGIDKQGFIVAPKVKEAWTSVKSSTPVVKLFYANTGYNDYTILVTMGSLTQTVAPASSPKI